MARRRLYMEVADHRTWDTVALGWLEAVRSSPAVMAVLDIVERVAVGVLGEDLAVEFAVHCRLDYSTLVQPSQI